MKNIPHWIVDVLMSKKFKCFDCQKVFTPKDLKAIGIRESFNDKEKEALYIENICSKCKKTTFFELQDMSLTEFAFEVLDGVEEEMDEKMEEQSSNERPMKKIKKENKIQKIEKSKITLKNFRDTVKKLKSLTNDDMLEAMGMPPEEIEKYKMED